MATGSRALRLRQFPSLNREERLKQKKIKITPRDSSQTEKSDPLQPTLNHQAAEGFIELIDYFY